MKIHLELPRDWQALLLPESLQERREAQALVQLVDTLALMRLRADAAQKRSA